MANPWLLRSIAISLDVGRSGARFVRGVSKRVSGGAGTVPEGDIFDCLPSTLGQKGYKKLLEDVNLALEEILYCQEALGDINAQGDENGQETESPAGGEHAQMKQMKDWINHDYLVLKLRPGDSNADDDVVHIKAHKCHDGIHIDIPSSDVTSYVHEGVHCFTVTCDRKQIRLEALVAILKEESPHYDAIFSNCWYYAQKTAKRLVKACIETPGISAVEKARLQEEHDNLQPNLIVKHFQNVVLQPNLIVKHLQNVMQSLVKGSVCRSKKGEQTEG